MSSRVYDVGGVCVIKLGESRLGNDGYKFLIPCFDVIERFQVGEGGNDGLLFLC